jgi:hypothetical protein
MAPTEPLLALQEHSLVSEENLSGPPDEEVVCDECHARSAARVIARYSVMAGSKTTTSFRVGDRKQNRPGLDVRG